MSITNTLKSYFCDIESELASALSKSRHHYKSCVNNHRHKIQCNSEEEVFLLLDQLDNYKKSFVIDKVHPFMLSIGALEIVKPLKCI